MYHATRAFHAQQDLVALLGLGQHHGNLLAQVVGGAGPQITVEIENEQALASLIGRFVSGFAPRLFGRFGRDLRRFLFGLVARFHDGRVIHRTAHRIAHGLVALIDLAHLDVALMMHSALA